MLFNENSISGLFTIKPEPFMDERGLLRRHFCQKEFDQKGILKTVRQCNISENKKCYTLRGFHYQLPPYGEDKILSCIKGAIHNIVLDMRIDSNTYLKWESFKLTEENRLSLHVPKGCANAYLTTEENTWIFYYHSEFYTPAAEAAIRYNDSFFKFDWPNEPAIISEKDKNIQDFKTEI
ncbi:MAG: dTDP-4-keto-6-deoxy-D-glucose epimerase [Deltaproteobacteria bacterium]|nr:dTDP-4-keto-6-deoxy-D-glucose epimerase [Deltaproteobacteria bacterium]